MYYIGRKAQGSVSHIVLNSRKWNTLLWLLLLGLEWRKAKILLAFSKLYFLVKVNLNLQDPSEFSESF